MTFSTLLRFSRPGPEKRTVDDPLVVPWVACAIIHPAPLIPGSPPLASSLGVDISEPQPPASCLWPVSLARLQLASFLGQPDGTIAGICQPWFYSSTTSVTLDPGPNPRSRLCCDKRTSPNVVSVLRRSEPSISPHQERKHTGRPVKEASPFWAELTHRRLASTNPFLSKE